MSASINLFNAIKNNDLNAIKSLISSGTDINSINQYGKTPLICASGDGDIDIVKYLLSNSNINVNIHDNSGNSALMQASFNGRLDIIEILITRPDIEINKVNQYGFSALILAAMKGWYQIVQLLLTVYKDTIQVNIIDNYGYTALIRAITDKHTNIVQLLLHHSSIDVNIKDKNGKTALIHAGSMGSSDIIQLLIKHVKVDVNITDNDGASALIRAVYAGYKQAVQILLKNNQVDTNINDNNGSCALHVAATKGYIDIMRLLISHPRIDTKVDVQFKDSRCLLEVSNHDQNVLLHDVVIHRCNITIIKSIIKKCPSCVHCKNSELKTPLDVAIDNQSSIEIIATLLLYNPITETTKSKWFPQFFKKKTSYSSHRVYGPLIQMLQSTSYDSVIRLHICGDGGAGKTTLKRCILANINSHFTYKVSESKRTIGLEIESFNDRGIKWIVYDYGGQEEYHINHSRFLRTNNSIYVIVINLCDFIGSNGETLQSPIPLSDERVYEITGRYNYWLKFINVSTSTNECNAHVITCLNGKSLIKNKSILSMAKQMIFNVQSQWMSDNEYHNHIEFINDKNGILLIDSIYTPSIRFKVLPILRNQAMKLKSKSNNNFKFVENMLVIRDNTSALFDVCRRSELFTIISQTFTTALSNNLKYDLAEASIAQLDMIGEILILNHYDDDDPLIITNPNKLSCNILGEIAKALQERKNQLVKDNKYMGLNEYSINTDDIKCLVGQSIRCSNGLDSDIIIKILELLGVCIRYKDNHWFPVFAADYGTIQMTDIFSLDSENQKYSRRIHRRYRLSKPQLQMFPNGYFSTLLVYVASMIQIEGNFQLYTNSIMIPECRVENLDGTISPCIETAIIISSDRTYFDVIIQSWVHDRPVDYNKGELSSRSYWKRLNNIKHIIYSDQRFIDYRVDLIEVFVHPDPRIQSEKSLSEMNAIFDNHLSIEERHSLVPWYYGINGRYDGVVENFNTETDLNYQNQISRQFKRPYSFREV